MLDASERRRAVPFGADSFAGQAAAGTVFGLTGAFRHAYPRQLWGGAESVSGEGAGDSRMALLPAGSRR